jgi:hypothetical protein
MTAAEIAAADHEDIRAEQARLDEEDLQEVERAEYYDDPPPLPAVEPAPAARGFFARTRAFLRVRV